MDLFLSVRQEVTARAADSKIRVRCWVGSCERVRKVMHGKTRGDGIVTVTCWGVR